MVNKLRKKGILSNRLHIIERNIEHIPISFPTSFHNILWLHYGHEADNCCLKSWLVSQIVLHDSCGYIEVIFTSEPYQVTVLDVDSGPLIGLHKVCLHTIGVLHLVVFWVYLFEIVEEL